VTKKFRSLSCCLTAQRARPRSPRYMSEFGKRGYVVRGKDHGPTPAKPEQNAIYIPSPARVTAPHLTLSNY
jgi:hypothetical protein